MKIMVDATALLLQSAGVKSVLYHWILAMRKLAAEETIEVYPPMPSVGSLDHQRSVTRKWATIRGIFMAVANQRFGVPFPEWAAKDFDVFHCSNQVRKPPLNCRLTATIHDLTCWKMPELHTEANVRADEGYAERVLKRADGLIAVSEHTRRDAIEVLGIQPEKIVTIPNGVSEAYFDVTEEESRQARMNHRLHRPYVLAVGTIEPRKNIDRLLDAWQNLKPALKANYHLVIAGPAGWGSEQTIARLRSAPKGVHWLGYVPESDLPGITRGAALLAYPSLYEGFGLPLAQAMAAGVPVLTSPVSSMPEVAGEAARFADPRSMMEIRDALTALLESQEERERRGAAGQVRARELYRWDKVAARSLEFFRKVTA